MEKVSFHATKTKKDPANRRNDLPEKEDRI
jgi:hypothetical protein